MSFADILGFDRSTISKFLKRFEERESCENSERSGRPKLTTSQGDRRLFRLVKRERRQSLGDITQEYNSATPRPVSKRTIQRRLHSDTLLPRLSQAENTELNGVVSEDCGIWKKIGAPPYFLTKLM